MIVILSHRTDLHARAVRRELIRAGHRVELLDVADLGAGDHLTFREGRRLGAVWTRAGGEEIDLCAAHTVWHRRIGSPGVPACATAPERHFAIAQWQTLLLGILECLPARLVNRPLPDRYLAKPYQLMVARELGLRIPGTIITSDAAAATRFAADLRGDLVHKPLTGCSVKMLATRRYDDASAASLAHLGLAPSIFQEAVCDGRELRITMVGRRIFAAEFRPPSGVVDGRTELEIEYRAHAVPDPVARQLHALMARFGLVYGTIDMKLTDAGEYVFLELNPQGQFLYIELLTGLPIAAAMAGLLADDPASARPRRRTPLTTETQPQGAHP